MASTVDKRDTVEWMLEVAAFSAQTEVREGFKKANVCWWREKIDGHMIQLLETNNYDGTWGKSECAEFTAESVDLERYNKPRWRALVDNERGLKAMTFALSGVSLASIGTFRILWRLKKPKASPNDTTVRIPTTIGTWKIWFANGWRRPVLFR